MSRTNGSDNHVCRHEPGGPLDDWLGGFSDSMRRQGYAEDTVVNIRTDIVRFNAWLAKENVGIFNLSDEVAARYLQDRSSTVRPGTSNSLRHLLKHLCSAGVTAPTPSVEAPVSDTDRILIEFELHLRDRNLADGSIALYAGYAKTFLRHCFADDKVDLTGMNADAVIGFVRHEAARLSNTETLKSVFNAMRMFLRFAHWHFDGMSDLTGALPAVANWPMRSLPRGISDDLIAVLEADIDRSTASGCRDYAILLLSRLGLRAIEISRLTLDDIDWRAARLTVVLKGGERCDYPLAESVGQAIAEYLRHFRPQSASRRVFLHLKAPFREFGGQTGFRHTLARRLKCLSADTPSCGTHQFRHALATRMLRCGVSLSEISDVLGHRHFDSTRIYAKADVEALRTLALPWPGGGR